MKTILIDLSYIAYRAQYACKELTYNDIPTGIIFGFFEQLNFICNNPIIKSNKVLIFTDSKKSYRSQVFPGYKQKRKQDKTEDEQQRLNIMYSQINKLKNKILPKLGFSVYKQTGLESDDLIAYAALKLTQEKEHGIIITSDGDLYQCINKYIKWYDPGRENLVDEKSFQKKKGIKPDLWGIVKSMAGCPSDCVPGLKGIGEKTALNYVTEKPISDKRLKTIKQGKTEIKKWAKLVILPHEKTKPFEIHSPKYKIKLFFSFCRHYNILSYLEPKRKAQWIKFFEGNFKGKMKIRERK